MLVVGPHVLRVVPAAKAREVREVPKPIRPIGAIATKVLVKLIIECAHLRVVIAAILAILAIVAIVTRIRHGVNLPDLCESLRLRLHLLKFPLDVADAVRGLFGQFSLLLLLGDIRVPFLECCRQVRHAFALLHIHPSHVLLHVSQGLVDVFLHLLNQLGKICAILEFPGTCADRQDLLLESFQLVVEDAGICLASLVLVEPVLHLSERLGNCAALLLGANLLAIFVISKLIAGLVDEGLQGILSSIDLSHFGIIEVHESELFHSMLELLRQHGAWGNAIEGLQHSHRHLAFLDLGLALLGRRAVGCVIGGVGLAAHGPLRCRLWCRLCRLRSPFGTICRLCVATVCRGVAVCAGIA
mmetsp:Transcript_118902/g.296639  ORF Transcript_118902/g.296639 Transcript_118902/m.296639 type:complete len:357 (+) Transcript_118902:327-1397(+)